MSYFRAMGRGLCLCVLIAAGGCGTGPAGAEGGEGAAVTPAPRAAGSVAEAGQTLRFYRGPQRPPSEVATLADMNSIFVVAIDGQKVRQPGGARPGTFDDVDEADVRNVYHLAPGRHQVAAKFEQQWVSVDGSLFREEAFSHFVFDHEFEPGKTYEFTLIETPERVEAQLAERVAPEEAMGGRAVVPLVMAEAGLAYPRPGGPRAGETGAVVSGIAREGEYHAGGKDVVLVRPGEEVFRWVARRREWVGRHGVWAVPDRGPQPPAAVREPVAGVLGQGAGQFVFRNVPAGEYLIVWDLANPTVSTLEVQPGQRVVEDVYAGPDLEAFDVLQQEWEEGERALDDLSF